MAQLRRLASLGFCLELLVAQGGCDTMQARSLVKEGNALYREGKIDEAIARYQAAARIDPDFPTLQLNLGYASLAAASAAPSGSAGKHARRAVDAFARFRELRPWDERGSKFYLQGLIDSAQLDRALAFLEAEHARSPRDVKIVASLGMVSSRAGRFDAALRWYQKRAELLPTDASARYVIGTLCWERLYKNASLVGAERVRIADHGISALEAALKLQALYPEALTYVNLLYRERAKGQSDPAAAERDLEQARRAYGRAVAQLKQRQAADAKKH
jgi:tetratricopeptide (TPR) repeat protein